MSLSFKSLVPKAKSDTVCIPALNLLDINELNAISGVRQAGNIPLPKPIMDFRKYVHRNLRGGPLDHVYWLRADVQLWLENLRKRRIIR